MTNDITTTAQMPTVNKALRQCLHNDMLAHRTETDLNSATDTIKQIMDYPQQSDKVVGKTLNYFYDGKIPYFGITDERWSTAVFKRIIKNKIPYPILIEILKLMDEVDDLPNPDRLIRQCKLYIDELNRTAESIKDEQARRLREKDTEPGAYKKTTTRAEREEAIRLAKTIAGLIPDINQTS